ncbi:MAG: HAD-IIB family hydrolase [Deltaproteobacteria bacterium]|nr:HAD-IIB family hydrolase [Deltaproteobacteria bacterium]
MNESTANEDGRLQLAVFTDLDGSLLDHYTYSLENARPALERIREQRIPLVFITSKTRPEVEMLQAAMGIREPFIVENGAAIFFPDRYREWRIDTGFRQPPYTVIQLGASYSEIRRFVRSVKPGFNIQGFGDLSAEDIGRLTGLSPKQAILARQREFTEPFLMEDDAHLIDLQRVAEASGFKVTRGGRFYHLMGSGQDKGIALRRTVSLFLQNTHRRLLTIGLGDSANDLGILESVDIPILIPHPDGSYEKLDLPNIRRARHPGSSGWSETILDVLNTIEEGAA